MYHNPVLARINTTGNNKAAQPRRESSSESEKHTSPRQVGLELSILIPVSITNTSEHDTATLRRIKKIHLKSLLKSIVNFMMPLH